MFRRFGVLVLMFMFAAVALVASSCSENGKETVEGKGYLKVNVSGLSGGELVVVNVFKDGKIWATTQEARSEQSEQVLSLMLDVGVAESVVVKNLSASGVVLQTGTATTDEAGRKIEIKSGLLTTVSVEVHDVADGDEEVAETDELEDETIEIEEDVEEPDKMESDDLPSEVEGEEDGGDSLEVEPDEADKTEVDSEEAIDGDRDGLEIEEQEVDAEIEIDEEIHDMVEGDGLDELDVEEEVADLVEQDSELDITDGDVDEVVDSSDTTDGVEVSDAEMEQDEEEVPVCNDSNPCTQDYFDPVLNRCVFNILPAGTPCEDGNMCTMNDHCDSLGRCISGTEDDCDDNNPCTADFCTAEEGCKNVPLDGNVCDDNDACTVQDRCVNGTCVGERLSCDDGNPCTEDSCDSMTGCVHEASTGSSCDDGLFCTYPDYCSDGVCTGSGSACPDTQCEEHVCSESGSRCIAYPKPSGESCNSGVSGAENGECTNGVCHLTVNECPGHADMVRIGTSSVCIDRYEAVASLAPNCNGQFVGQRSDDYPAGFPDDVGSGSSQTNPVYACSVPGVLPSRFITWHQAKQACANAGKFLCGLTQWQQACKGPYITEYPYGDEYSPSACNGSDFVDVYGNEEDVVRRTAEASSCANPFGGHDFSGNAAEWLNSTQGGSVMVAGGSAADSSDALTCSSTDLHDPGFADSFIGFRCCAYIGSTPPNCDDGNPCTADSFDGEQCQHIPLDGTACTVSNLCADAGTCHAGVCEASIRDCNDDNECTNDYCDPETGACVNEPIDKPCDDGNACTVNDMCSNGVCAGEMMDCDDGNVCTDDSCNPDTGTCEHSYNSAPCDDGNACTVADTCNNGACVGVMRSCDDGNPCTDDWCNAQTGSCEHGPNSSLCDDGNPCTSNDICIDSECVGEMRDCSDDNPCTVDYCDPVRGCVSEPLPDGTACSDGSVCTTGDVCQNGSCVGSDVSCDDGNPCTVDSCDAELGCVNTVVVGESCDDGNPCTSNDVCREDGTCSGSEISCDDGNPCTVDFCNPESGCDSYPVEDGTECDDGNLCTMGDTCVSGVCSGSLVAIDDGNPCTVDSCNESTGEVVHEPVDGISCDDGNPCTVGDVCSNGTCTGQAKDCSELDSECSVGTCSPDSGECMQMPKPIGTACSDGICVGVECVPEGNCPGHPDMVLLPNGDGCIDRFESVLRNNQQCTGAAYGTEADDYPDGFYDDVSSESQQTQLFACQAGGVLPSRFLTWAQANVACQNMGKQLCSPEIWQISCSGTEGRNYPYGTEYSADSCNGAEYAEDSSIMNGGAASGCVTPDGVYDLSGNVAEWLSEVTGSNAAVAGGSFESDAESLTCTSLEYLSVDSALAAVGLRCCVPVDPEACDDLNPCTRDFIENGECKHEPMPDGTSCEDGNACTENDVCNNGRCVAGNEVSCDDENDCTTDTCRPDVGCVNEPVANGTSCDDGNSCTINDVCTNGVCGGETNDCADGNPCTDDICDPELGCLHNPLSGTECNDGNACTVNDSCQNGQCVGEETSCDDENPCTSDWCSPETGCEHSNISGSCDDGDPCTIGDFCSEGSCVAGNLRNCDDENPCTSDWCGEDGACHHTPISAECDDGNACTGSDYCNEEGVCVGQTISCDDGNPCTVDSCNPQSGCTNEFLPEGTECSDGNACTNNDHCNAEGQCVGSTIDCDDGNECTNDSCLPDVGCVWQPREGLCDDGLYCTTGDHCVSGECVGELRRCVDDDPCTDDICNDEVDSCQHLPNTGNTCDDGNLCTENDTCQEGICTGTPKQCPSDGNPCTDELCDPAIGCYTVNNNDPCDDGLFCTVGDVCNNGVCSGSTRDCGTATQCSSWSCNEEFNRCEQHNVPNGTACDDGDPNTTVDICVDGACNGLTNQCPGHPEMMLLDGQDVCIDRYEAVVYESSDCSGNRFGASSDDYPTGFPDNVGEGGIETTPLYACSISGEIPSRFITWAQAKRACENSGKRLCTVLEWRNSCRGPSGTNYPYGNSYSAGVCVDNTYDGNPGYQLGSDDAHLAGEASQCSNSWGLFDMSGNVREWVSTQMGPTSVWHGCLGGAFLSGDANELSCMNDYGCNGTIAYAEVGFRCCADVGAPDGDEDSSETDVEDSTDEEIPSWCSIDEDCPVHYYCDFTQHCAKGCSFDDECDAGMVCTTHGRCVVPEIDEEEDVVDEPDIDEEDVVEPELEPDLDDTPEPDEEPQCLVDDDCGPGLYCNTEGRCVMDCWSDDQCEPGYVCIEERGKCVPSGADGDSSDAADEPQCTSDDQCEYGTYCKNGMCDFDCGQDSDCSPSEVCDVSRGRCVPAGTDGDEADEEAQNVCTTDDDCPYGTFCDPNGNCAVECSSDADCAAPKTCDLAHGRCVDDSGCTNDEECPAYYYCDEATMTCVAGCHSDADCPSGYTCSTAHGRCYPPSDGDEFEYEDLDVEEGPIYCTTDEECPADQFCMGGTICGRECGEGIGDCSVGYICNERGKCVQDPDYEAEEEEPYCGPQPPLHQTCIEPGDCYLDNGDPHILQSTNKCACEAVNRDESATTFVNYIIQDGSCIEDPNYCADKVCDGSVDCVNGKCVYTPNECEGITYCCHSDEECRTVHNLAYYHCTFFAGEDYGQCESDCYVDENGNSVGCPDGYDCNDIGYCVDNSGDCEGVEYCCHSDNDCKDLYGLDYHHCSFIPGTSYGNCESECYIDENNQTIGCEPGQTCSDIGYCQ